MKTRALIVMLAAVTATVAAQNAAFRIVVIEDDDGVNIIQQKTAVRPVAEVRDRNNLPVPGVLVIFSIEGGKAASFVGASTLTVRQVRPVAVVGGGALVATRVVLASGSNAPRPGLPISMPARR